MNQLYYLWYDGKSIQSHAEVKARGEINCILDTQNGDVYIGHRNGIDIYHTTTKKISSLPVSSKQVVAILKAHDGNLYYASDENRLTCYNPKQGERILSTKSKITDLAEDREGRIWASTQYGDLLCYHPATGKITIDDKGSNASGDNIKHITIDNKGHLWLLSDQMVKEYNPQKRGLQGIPVIRQGHSDGLFP